MKQYLLLLMCVVVKCYVLRNDRIGIDTVHREYEILQPIEDIDLQLTQDQLESVEQFRGRPVTQLIEEHRNDGIIDLTTDQQRSILQQYGSFFTPTSSKSYPMAGETIFSAQGDGNRGNTNYGTRVCEVTSGWNEIGLAMTADNRLVQVVQLSDLQYKQLIFEETCLTTSCTGVSGTSQCVAVPRYVRGYVIDLDTNKFTTSDIQVHSCACHTQLFWNFQ
ncbi:uncharacterized protein LOC144351279 [Saccoglossus kowalevskii]